MSVALLTLYRPSTSRIRMTNEWDASVITPDTAPHAAAALTPNNHCDKCGRDMHSHCFLNVRKAGHCTHCIRCRAVRSTIRKATEQQPPGMDNAFVRADIEDLMRDYLSSWKSRVNRLQSQDLFHSDFDPETMGKYILSVYTSRY